MTSVTSVTSLMARPCQETCPPSPGLGAPFPGPGQPFGQLLAPACLDPNSRASGPSPVPGRIAWSEVLFCFSLRLLWNCTWDVVSQAEIKKKRVQQELVGTLAPSEPSQRPRGSPPPTPHHLAFNSRLGLDCSSV